MIPASHIRQGPPRSGQSRSPAGGFLPGSDRDSGYLGISIRGWFSHRLYHHRDLLAAPQFDIHILNEYLATFIKIIDIFLVATVFYIIALGFFELFIAKAPLPGWLKICDLDDLKDKLLGLVVIALAVVLLGEALTWDKTANILSFGLAVAAGIAAISVYFWVKR